MKKTIKECIVEGFEGSRNTMTFTNFSNDEYVGFVTAMTISNYGSKIACPVMEVIEIARKLVSEKII